MSGDVFVWDRVEWRQGDGRYVFKVETGGLVATLASPHGREMTLPMVAWEGLLDALAAARKARVRSERATPSRAGARWTRAETDDLVAAFKAGTGVSGLARDHNRTQFAIEAQLAALGLWDREGQRPLPAAVRFNRSIVPPDWPADLPRRDHGRQSTEPVAVEPQPRRNSG